MIITDFLSEKLIVVGPAAKTKHALFAELSEYVVDHANVGVNAATICAAIEQREALGSTNVGDAVAIPHAKIHGLTQLTACFAQLSTPLTFQPDDQEPVRLVFVLLVPENSAGTHLKALARIARLLKNPGFRERLYSLHDAKGIYEAFSEEDAKH